ncbi:MAG: phosphopantetheine-binding protein [Balneolaceae bacterium]|nr:phosphopantetheine-binding protein [Balneolaceae bacterium]
MNRNELEAVIKKHLHRVAPEADLRSLDSREDLGSALDLDSMDIYTMMVAVSEEMNVEIPEREYGNLRSLDHMLDFLLQSAEK